VDGKDMPEHYLAKRVGAYGEDMRSAVLQEACEAIGMDCSSFVFQHNVLAPDSIIVEDVPTKGIIGIIDWYCAGYLPRGWIATKFRLCPGLDLDDGMPEAPQRYRG
jgi:hypothetical protein